MPADRATQGGRGAIRHWHTHEDHARITGTGCGHAGHSPTGTDDRLGQSARRPESGLSARRSAGAEHAGSSGGLPGRLQLVRRQRRHGPRLGLRPAPELCLPGSAGAHPGLGCADRAADHGILDWQLLGSILSPTALVLAAAALGASTPTGPWASPSSSAARPSAKTASFACPPAGAAASAAAGPGTFAPATRAAARAATRSAGRQTAHTPTGRWRTTPRRRPQSARQARRRSLTPIAPLSSGWRSRWMKPGRCLGRISSASPP